MFNLPNTTKPNEWITKVIIPLRKNKNSIAFCPECNGNIEVSYLSYNGGNKGAVCYQCASCGKGMHFSNIIIPKEYFDTMEIM